MCSQEEPKFEFRVCQSQGSAYLDDKFWMLTEGQAPVDSDCRIARSAVEAEVPVSGPLVPMASVHSDWNSNAGRKGRHELAVPILSNILLPTPLPTRESASAVVAQRLLQLARCVQALQDDHHVGCLHQGMHEFSVAQRR